MFEPRMNRYFCGSFCRCHHCYDHYCCFRGKEENEAFETSLSGTITDTVTCKNTSATSALALLLSDSEMLAKHHNGHSGCGGCNGRSGCGCGGCNNRCGCGSGCSGRNGCGCGSCNNGCGCA